MLLRYIYDEKLAQASYFVGCPATGEAVVIDPARNVSPYIDMAASQGLKITAVTETHIHADFVSGARQLAEETGATLLLSDEGGPDWRYAFADQHNHALLKDGDTFEIGNITFEVMHTPRPHARTHFVSGTRWTRLRRVYRRLCIRRRCGPPGPTRKVRQSSRNV
jgi:hydroxyacylglutathione hydrolase